MATPQRNLIMEQVERALANIKTSTGYRNTVDTVERRIREWDSVGKQEFPYIGAGCRRTDYEHMSCNQVRARMIVDIVVHVSAADYATASDNLSTLEDDLWEALTVANLNSGSGGTDLATMVKVLFWDTDEADPDAGGSKGGTGTGHMQVEIIYHRTTGETT